LFVTQSSYDGGRGHDNIDAWQVRVYAVVRVFLLLLSGSCMRVCYFSLDRPSTRQIHRSDGQAPQLLTQNRFCRIERVPMGMIGSSSTKGASSRSVVLVRSICPTNSNSITIAEFSVHVYICSDADYLCEYLSCRIYTYNHMHGRTSLNVNSTPTNTHPKAILLLFSGNVLKKKPKTL